jgi:hypothetical protein
MVRRFMPVVAAALLAGLIVGGVSRGSSSEEGSHQRNFRALEVTGEEHFVDVDGNNDFSPGDEFIFTDDLKTPSGSKKIGSLTGICTFTQIVSEEDSSGHCVVTATVQGGTIEIAGLVHFSSQTDFVVAITGGTQRYDEAHGQVFGTDQQDGTTLLRFDVD